MDLVRKKYTYYSKKSEAKYTKILTVILVIYNIYYIASMFLNLPPMTMYNLYTKEI